MNSYTTRIKFLFAFLSIFWVGITNAQEFKNLTFLQLPLNGISHHTVNCIYQDDRDFIWLGTINGLNRYDGNNYKVFRADEGDGSGLSSNYINSINQDKNGNIWIGTKYGVNVLMKDGDFFKKYLPNDNNPTSINSTNIEIVFRDSKDRMWIGTWGGLSLYREESDDFVNFIHEPGNEHSISGNVITEITEDSKGRLWVGTAYSGLNLLNPATNKFQRFQKEATKKNCISGNSISAIYEDEKGQIWVGAERGGLNRFEEKTQTFKWYFNEGETHNIASNTVYSIIEDGNGDLMIGGMNGGISVYDGVSDNFFRYDTQGNYNPFGSKASVYCHYKLRTGEVMIATSNGGVKIQDNYPSAITLFKHSKGDYRSLPMNNVSAICEDANGNFWIGTSGGGLSHLTTETGNFKAFPTFKDKTINCLMLDIDNNLWIGTLENGLAKYSHTEDQFKYFHHEFQLSGGTFQTGQVNCLIAHDNGLWAATTTGVRFLNVNGNVVDSYVYSFSGNNKLAIGQVNSLLLDHEKRLWAASESGLHYFDKRRKVFIQYEYQSPGAGKKQEWVSYFYEDSQHNIWVSNLKGGLTWLNTERQPENFNILSNNLQISEVTNIIEDQKGAFWITCRQGLLKCEVNHNNKTIRVLNSFNKNDGLQGEVFNINAGILSRQTGALLLGGLEGLNIFNPKEMNLNPNIPPVVLTELRLNGRKFDFIEKQEVSALQEISFSEKEVSTIDLHYAALNYVKPKKNQYAYILEGYEKNWHYPGNKGLVSYANLSPGNYNLRIKAANNDGVWNNKGASLIINVHPVLWNTTTFKIIALAFGLMAILLGIVGYKRKISRWSWKKSLVELLFSNYKPEENTLSKDFQDKAFMEKAIRYVELNLADENLCIENLCSELGLSRAKLFRKIKDLTGRTVSNFIKDIRLEKAKIYLDSNPRSVGEVAFTIGFKSHAHFTRSFKEKYGISPSAYVQQRK